MSTGQLTTMSQMLQRLNLNWSTCAESLIQTRNYAARKSTRERKLKILRAIKAKKLARLAHLTKEDTGPKKFQAKAKAVQLPLYLTDKEYMKKPIPEDNVFVQLYHQRKIYPLAEAVEAHREYCHPTMMNQPNAFLRLFVEFNMKGVKKTKPVTTFSRTAPVPHIFDHKQSRTIAAFCKTFEESEEAKKAGATIVFGAPEIKEIAKGSILLDDYSVLVAHTSIMPELTAIKGYMRKKYPAAKAGTLSSDLTTLIKTHLHGIQYTVHPYPNYSEYGYGSILIGTLDMKPEHLKENCSALMEDIYAKRPKRSGPFVLRVRLACDGSSEQFQVDMNEFYTDTYTSQATKKSSRTVDVEEEDDDDENTAVISSV